MAKYRRQSICLLVPPLGANYGSPAGQLGGARLNVSGT
jgi:hypothetical protein